MSLVNSLADKLIEWQHETNPFIATQRGKYYNQTKVPTYTAKSFKKQVNDLKDFQNKLFAIKKQELSTHEQVNWHLVDITIRQQLRQLTVIKYYEKDPGFVSSQLISIIYVMLSREYAPIQDRLNALECRLKLTQSMLESGRDLVKNPPVQYTNQAIAQCKHGIKFLTVTVPEIITAQNGTISTKFKFVLNNTIKQFTKHVTWLESILPISKGKFAIGEENFNNMLQQDYLMDYTAESLIKKGKQLLNETKQQMTSLAQEINPNLTWQEIINDMKNYHPAEHEILEVYKQESQKVKQFVVSNNIADFPKNEELILINTPLHMRSLFPYAGYSGPAVFDKFQSGRFWVTPVEPEWSTDKKEQKLREHMFYKIPVFVLHEGYPGHHLQISTQHNLPENIRKIMHNNLFCEGWAFYCEELLENLGYISHPKTRLSRLKDQLWRASRIIIDASLHSERMSFNEAVDLLINEAHLEKMNAVAEVSRYIKNPLRPMSYLMGKLELLEIAKDYKELKGESYCLKEFHNELLQLGAIPPKLVRLELLK
ncbi:DUF885 domain-containing protein [Clostridium sp. 'deep sea']|uniref:DUF885 domain-containing protein n=1 Tax=Clostridium sp. 'deep sea' TaxID=2779445 RepID=UPI0018969B6F|nr:DUF885 domain-containing protein [Clostridium sp. 'deep sea']QOR35971.1 DUF885 domain-containing protein [Clostridium sp. 'deep sea']